MHRDLLIKSRTLGGTSDLTLLAPIKPDLAPSLESITYKSRIKRLLKTLNSGRTSSQEYSLLRAFSDAVERVGKIHSVRVAIVEPDQLLLSVTFDGNMETYMRVLWQKVGTLLDIIFCNTEDYVSAWGSRYEDWADWVRRVQIETDFFFGTPSLTVEDVHYLRNEELLHRSRPDSSPSEVLATQLMAVRQNLKSAEQKTWQVVSGNRPDITGEMGRQGLRALALFYRLSALFLPNTPDGDYLHRAARDILMEFVLLAEKSKLDEVILLGQQRFDEQLRWLLRPVAPSAQREVPVLQKNGTPTPDDKAHVQAGILRAYPESLNHGCLLLIAFDNRTAAADFLDAMHSAVTKESANYAALNASLNLAVTADGLRALGLSDDQLGVFPMEFREGMEARASVLGDVRINHPRRWQLPRRNMALDAAGRLTPTASAPQIELSAVHAVVQVRMAGMPVSLGAELVAGDPLTAHVAALLAPHPGVKLLSVQPLIRNMVGNQSREHFGYVDGLSQPVLDPALNGTVYNHNQIHLGEILWGYDNEAEKAPKPAVAQEQLSWLKDGSFLVIRKLKQDVAAFEKAVAAAAAATGLSAATIKNKMMGRGVDGIAPVPTPAGKPNDFDFSRESAPGAQCPFHSHIRRSNPRLTDDENLAPAPAPGKRTPRIMRRGMSYGPRFDPNALASANDDRGLVFMAYNASIAEQFEVIQRWISGGNSSGGFSGHSDPLMGVPVTGQQRYFRFEEAGKSYQIALDGYNQRPGEPVAFVRLQWGAYLFTPSIKVVEKLARLARTRAGEAAKGPWSVTDGWKRIQALFAMERTHGTEAAAESWKAALEDPEAQRNFESASIWAAIRTYCAGVLRTPYGVLVADRFHIDEVLHDDKGLYSVSGYHDRMTQSIGEIYLGLDDQGPGCPYRVQANPVNTAINTLSRQATFDTARAATQLALGRLIGSEIALAKSMGAQSVAHWELNLDVKEVIDRALVALCQAWFGLPERSPEIKAGGARWDWKPGDLPLYPGHFTAPSRYFFQPRPGHSAQEYGHLYGTALRGAFARLIKRHRDNPATEPKLNAGAALAAVILTASPRSGASVAADAAADDQAARTMIGAMMGFLPTLDGNLRLSMNEWLRDGTFWSLRAALAGPAALQPQAALAAAHTLLEQPLKHAMQLRPSPELIWRTATRHAKLGEEALRPGDKIVLALVSSTHAALESDPPVRDADVYAIFGGQRKVSGYPTHACPGYEAAFGAMLGILYALMESPHTMRPSVAPLALVLEGDVPQPQPNPLPAKPGRAPAPGTPPAGLGHTLLAAGDSWMCYESSITFKPQNIANCLVAHHGFKVETQAGYTAPGNWLREYFKDVAVPQGDIRLTQPLPGDAAAPAAPPRLLQNLCASLKRLIETGAPPTAILLSAGGNDVAGRRLAKLVDISNPASPALRQSEVAQTVDVHMRAWLEYALDEITATSTSLMNGKTIPIVIHGYDFPVPDGRHSLAGILLPHLLWLYPSFVPPPPAPSPVFPALPAYNANHVKLMQDLIERLNAMQKTVAALPRFSGHVIHADLTGTLSNTQANYKDHWDNELHPNEAGFTALTARLVAIMQNRIPAL
jgi:Dyp-type peroxidase family